ncbi:hypothetical protein FDP41_002383 [Naegleria fowleri]|uniref:UBR-type domain-containing protein n=1 Tax=Naegleria fowleri TaxID=5763 RepID=A0A6A5BKN8_NAEFO|nr:uncharacterized protein FDP41_002383 [Naegleria fowleri]KAF0978563.1 hypothetical protein FDP41_002383 [Naegleria fowleri]CAG4713741.1 unnamed protein product [Naegleria fowleri]
MISDSSSPPPSGSSNNNNNTTTFTTGSNPSFLDRRHHDRSFLNYFCGFPFTNSGSRSRRQKLLSSHYEYSPLLHTNGLSGRIKFAPSLSSLSSSNSLLLALASSYSNSLHILQFKPLSFIQHNEYNNNNRHSSIQSSCQLISSYFEYHTHDIQSLEWYHENFIFSSSLDCTLCQYDVPSSKLVKRLCVASHSILNGITLSQESPPVLYICCNNSILMWDTREKKHSILVKSNRNVNPNGSLKNNDYIHVKLKNIDSPYQLVASRGGGVLEFRDLRFNSDFKYSLYHDDGCEFTSLEIHPYDDYVLTYCEDGIVYELFENYNLWSGGGNSLSSSSMNSSGSMSSMNNSMNSSMNSSMNNNSNSTPFKKSIYKWYSSPLMKNKNQIGFKNASYSRNGNYIICGNDDGHCFIFDASLPLNSIDHHHPDRSLHSTTTTIETTTTTPPPHMNPHMNPQSSSFISPPLIPPMKIIPPPTRTISSSSSNHYSPVILNSLFVPNLYDQSEIHNLLITYEEEEPSMYLFGMTESTHQQQNIIEKFDSSIDEAEMVQDIPMEEWQHNSIQSETKVCSYSLGYATQIVYICLTCYRNRNRYNYSNNEIYHGVCEECSKHCHRGHELYNIGEKRNFKCDCGNSQCGNVECLCSTSQKSPINELNQYNHNFKNEWCYCGREEANPMYQCYNCYDWFHGNCIFTREYDSENNLIEDYSYVCENCWNLATSREIGNHQSIGSSESSCSVGNDSNRSNTYVTLIRDSIVTNEYPSNDTIVRRGKFVKLSHPSSSNNNNLTTSLSDQKQQHINDMEEGEDLLSQSSGHDDEEEDNEFGAQQGANLDDFIVEDDDDVD